MLILPTNCELCNSELITSSLRDTKTLKQLSCGTDILSNNYCRIISIQFKQNKKQEPFKLKKLTINTSFSDKFYINGVDINGTHIVFIKISRYRKRKPIIRYAYDSVQGELTYFEPNLLNIRATVDKFKRILMLS